MTTNTEETPVNQPTATTTGARQRREQSREWYGYLTFEDFDHVVARLRNLFGDGQRFTFVAVNATQAATSHPEVQTGCVMEAGGWTDHTDTDRFRLTTSSVNDNLYRGVQWHTQHHSIGLHTWHATEAEARHSVAVRDGAKDPMGNATYVHIVGGVPGYDGGRDNRVEITQTNGYGEILRWTMKPEPTE